MLSACACTVHIICSLPDPFCNLRKRRRCEREVGDYMDDDEVVRPKVKRNRTAYTVVTSIWGTATLALSQSTFLRILASPRVIYTSCVPFP